LAEQTKEQAKEQTLLTLAPATALTFAAEAVVAAEPGVAAAVTVAKSALSVVALAAEAAEAVAPGLRCPPYSALPRVVLLDRCFAAVRPSLDSSR
jgi:hypothetical protein